jgi:hypothetical protein
MSKLKATHQLIARPIPEGCVRAWRVVRWRLRFGRVAVTSGIR